MTHKLVVASTNPVKIGAALAGFQRMFPEQVYEARGVSARSGVSDQPMSDRETLQGALNRVEDARRLAPDADYWIGLEGGVERVGVSLEAFAWIVVSDGHTVGKARTASYFLPDETARLIEQGMELGHADDVVFGRANSKQQNGSVGLLTGDVIDRAMYYEHAVILALIPFKNPQLSFNAENG
jgi:inosine/xanthosine triphosphatase